MNPDREYLKQAVELSRQSPQCATSYRVGAIIVTVDQRVYGGYTHETAPNNHAEEVAITKALADGAVLDGATIYCSMEPCTTRASKPKSCSRLIIEHGISRVVMVLREPDRFAVCRGVEMLTEAGVEVIEMDEFASEVLAINSYALGC